MAIADLTESGVRQPELIEPLTHLATQQECLSRELRVRAIFALAVLESQNPNWKSLLGRMSKQRGSFEYDTATMRLDRLNKR